MIRTLRALFLGRLFREKVLLVALALIGTLFWLSNFVGRTRSFLEDSGRVTTSLTVQSRYLENRASIEAAAQRAASNFDPALTLDSSRLLGKVNAIANQVGVRNPSIGTPQDTSAGQFSTHTFEFSVSKVDWNTLAAFCSALLKNKPYIQIEQFTAASNPPGTDSLTARLTITSVETVAGH